MSDRQNQIRLLKRDQGELMSALTPSDLEMFAKLGIPPELVALARIERVTDREARDTYRINGTGDRSGIVIPYIDPETGRRLTSRLRRDRPDIEDGKPKGKYISAYQDRRRLYFPPGSAELLKDPAVDIVLVEAEKSSLALTAWSARTGIKILPIGMGGCYGWRGKIGKVELADGSRGDEKGPLPDLDICNGRRVVILLDANANTNRNVRRARFDLARELGSREGTTPLIASLPDTDGVNGPDDLIGVCGDEVMKQILANAVHASDAAREHLEEGIRKLASDKGRQLANEERELYFSLLADVRDPQQREILITEFARAYRVLTKATIRDEVDRLRDEHAKERTQIVESARVAALKQMKIDPSELIATLEDYFCSRAHLPEGAALTLSFFALNTWIFDAFDTTPYLNVESAVPGCGKSTVLNLLRVCRSPVEATGLTEAAMFRIIHDSSPTLLIDEAEFIEGKSDRAQMLRAIANAGYKRGAMVPRCGSGEKEFKLEYFRVYCPKVFAIIGGLSGTLLERSIVVHMSKRPEGVQLKRSRERILNRDVEPLRKCCEAYALQAREYLVELYDREPDQGYWPHISDREAEIWGPLLLHARLAGPEVEQRLLSAFDALSQQKIDIQSEEWNTALAVELRDAIEKTDRPDGRFTPADLLNSLQESENWGTKLAKYKADDSKSRSSAIGRFLKRFRLKSRDRKREGMSYLKSEALEVASSLTPGRSFTSFTLSPNDANPQENLELGEDHEKPTSFTGSFTGSFTKPTSLPDTQSFTTSFTKSFTDVSHRKDTELLVSGERVKDVKDKSEGPAHTQAREGEPERCRTHGEHFDWWSRDDGSKVCEQCHPNPFTAATRVPESSANQSSSDPESESDRVDEFGLDPLPDPSPEAESDDEELTRTRIH